RAAAPAEPEREQVRSAGSVRSAVGPRDRCKKKGPAHTAGPFRTIGSRTGEVVGVEALSVHPRRLRNGRVRRWTNVSRRAPVLIENRVQQLVDVLAVALKRLAQNRFLHGAYLLQRAVAAAVDCRRAGLETMHADRVEHERHHELGALREYAGAPERRADGKAPFRCPEVGIQLTDLENPDCGL